MLHLAPNTTSKILAKSISKDGGTWLLPWPARSPRVPPQEELKDVCDGLMMDDRSRSDTCPTSRSTRTPRHRRARGPVGKIGEEQLFYLRSRGLTEEEAAAMIVNGFIEPVTKELPMEYAIELNRLIQLEMEGSIG